MKNGNFAVPQRGTQKKGYRLDNAHPGTSNPSEQGPHINTWDYTKAKRKRGGEKNVFPIDDK